MEAAASLHRALASWNARRLTPSVPGQDWRDALVEDAALALREGEWIEHERAELAPLLEAVPGDPDAFLRWFEALREHGPGQGDPLFRWLADEAGVAEMRWFLAQELAGEAGFDDLVALTQLKLPERPKLELARNYWDEMGRGRSEGMHGPMLSRLASALEVPHPGLAAVVEALALSNLLVALACNRRYAWLSVGALGVIELTAPDRAVKVDAGLRRLGVGGRERLYFALHSTLDRQHSEAWNREVLHPLVRENPSRAVLIAEGALLRLRAGQRCFDRYRRELGLEHASTQSSAGMSVSR
jgi:hypothetical protein